MLMQKGLQHLHYLLALAKISGQSTTTRKLLLVYGVKGITSNFVLSLLYYSLNGIESVSNISNEEEMELNTKKN